MVILNRQSKIPLYIQIYSQLKNAILNGSIPSGTKLLSRRKLAEQQSVSVNTVDLAYSQLVSEGFIESAPQKGYYVCPMEQLQGSAFLHTPICQRENKIKQNQAIDFSIDGVDRQVFPYTTWKKLFRQIFSQENDILRLSPSQGEYLLRSAISSYLYIARGVNCQADQLVISTGTDQLIQLINRLVEKNATITMENPVYHEAYLSFQRTNRTIRSIPVDNYGIQTKYLTHLHNTVLYVTPSHQFPLGFTMPAHRRIQLLNWAKEENSRYIIEDDYDSEFRFSSKPIPSLQSMDKNGKVIYLGSFSRSIAPSLRISYMVLPHTLLSIYKKTFDMFCCPVSKAEQLILAHFIKDGYYETHLNKMRKCYREKRRILSEELQHLFDRQIVLSGENAGQNLLMKCKNGMTEQQLCDSARRNGVLVHPVAPFFIDEVPKQYHSTVLLGYAALSHEKIIEGCQLLKKAWITK